MRRGGALPRPAQKPPLPKGGHGDRRTDCHTSDIGHWFAMTWFFQGVRWGLFSLSLLLFSRFCGILGVFNLTLKEFSPWKP